MDEEWVEFYDENAEPTLLIIGVNNDRSQHMGWELAYLGYRVVMTEENDDIGQAIYDIMPNLILMDYSMEARAKGITPRHIMRYLAGDAPGCHPPLVVIAEPQMRHEIPEGVAIYAVLLPTSLDVLSAVVREHVTVEML